MAQVFLRGTPVYFRLDALVSLQAKNRCLVRLRVEQYLKKRLF